MNTFLRIHLIAASVLVCIIGTVSILVNSAPIVGIVIGFILISQGVWGISHNIKHFWEK